MRPRAISGVSGLDPRASPSERFQKFAQMIVSVPKAEADKEMEKSGLGKKAIQRKQRAMAVARRVERRSGMDRKIKRSGRERAVGKQLRDNLKELEQSIKRNASAVKQQLSQSGAKPGEAVVISAAKYHEALDRLAKE